VLLGFGEVVVAVWVVVVVLGDGVVEVVGGVVWLVVAVCVADALWLAGVRFVGVLRGLGGVWVAGALRAVVLVADGL
jgi:hypothetical protein